MNSNLTLTNSSQFNIADEEILLRNIPSKIKIGDLSTDALRLLVYYVSKAGPFELAVDSGYFEGTLEERLQSMKSTLQFKSSVETYADLANLEGLVAGDVVFVRFTSLAYIYDGEAFAAEPEGISISGPSAYDIAVQNGFVGTVPEWLDSLKGEVGDEGEQGLKGDKGDKGDTGLSAYELATADVVDAPTLEEWLLSLKGVDGANGLKGDTGANGKNAYETYVEMYQASNKAAAEQAAEAAFPTYEEYILRPGNSEYTIEDYNTLKADVIAQAGQVAAQETPTIEDWFNAIKGADGVDGKDGVNGENGTDGKSAFEVAVGNGFEGTELEWLASLKGDKGDAFTFADFTPEQLEGLKGAKGEDGVDGLDGKAFTYEDFTPTQLEGLKGPKGDQGEPGPKGEDGVTQDATTIVLTGLDTADATAAVETDTLLTVIGKLQAQINSLTARLEALETPLEM